VSVLYVTDAGVRSFATLRAALDDVAPQYRAAYLTVDPGGSVSVALDELAPLSTASTSTATMVKSWLLVCEPACVRAAAHAEAASGHVISVFPMRR
jgi:hypothetical protein